MAIQVIGAGSRVKHESYGVGVVVKTAFASYYITFFQHGYLEIPHTDTLEIIEEVKRSDDTVSLQDVQNTLVEILEKWGGTQEVIELGTKWYGGTMLLQPADTSLKPKEVPIEVFFHKIVMLRDRLRVMEQRINSSTNLNDEEKVNLQQYLTRIYGSLTTFNILFKAKDDYFRGASK
jgi:hypothetical protein